MVGGEGGMEGGDGGEGGEEGKGDESGLLPPPSSSFSAIPTIKQISEDFLVFTEFVKTSNDPDENNKGLVIIITITNAKNKKQKTKNKKQKTYLILKINHRPPKHHLDIRSRNFTQNFKQRPP